jgi:DNA-binding transcriptional LysR family regulator
LHAYRGEEGTLPLGLIPSSAFNPLLSTMVRAFKRRWPGVLITLSELTTLQLLLDIREERLDAIFIRPGDDELDGLRLKRFAGEKMLIVLPNGHPLARREILPLAALAGEPFVLYPPAVGLGLHHEILATGTAGSSRSRRNRRRKSAPRSIWSRPSSVFPLFPPRRRRSK